MKEQKSKGENVKAGYARIKIKEEWKLWEEIEKELNRADREEGRREMGEREKGIGEEGGDGFYVSQELEGNDKKGKKECIVSEINEEKEKLNIISVYNKVNWNMLGNKIEKWIEEKEDKQIIVEGDFNIRIGELGGGDEEEGGERDASYQDA
ncbi:hypothetical protein RF55_14763 [Lasius niger]|uniref:Uncharacterized protein n=1 Tax=Lasius niger TaxID=67767 RepID=A0A0J7N0W1_LASNI|nr:hypothetical protein RF55_14763 [Lasius niger]